MHARILSLSLVTFSLVACGGAETPPADTAAPAAAPAPAGLTEADIAGTWNWTAMPEGSDSVIARGTEVCAAGTCRGTMAERPDTLLSTYRIDGDSVIGQSQPYMDPQLKRNVVDHVVFRITGGTMNGVNVVKLADKDSVVMRARFTATKAP